MTPQAAIDDAATRSAGTHAALLSAVKAHAEAFVANKYPTSTGEVVGIEFLHKIFVLKQGPFRLAWQLFPWPWSYAQIMGLFSNGVVTFTDNFADWAEDSAFPGMQKTNLEQTFYVTPQSESP